MYHLTIIDEKTGDVKVDELVKSFVGVYGSGTEVTRTTLAQTDQSGVISLACSLAKETAYLLEQFLKN